MSMLNPAPYDNMMPIGTIGMVGPSGSSHQPLSNNSIQRKKTAKKNQRIQKLLETMTTGSRGNSMKSVTSMSSVATAPGPATSAPAVRQPGFESYAFLAGSSPAPALAQQQFTTAQRNMSAVGAGNPLLGAIDDGDDPTSGGLGSFSPLPTPISSGMERIQVRQQSQQSQQQNSRGDEPDMDSQGGFRSVEEDDLDDDEAISSGSDPSQPSALRRGQQSQQTQPRQSSNTVEDYTNLDASPYMDTQRVHYPTNPNNTARIPYSIPAFIDGSKPLYNQALPYSTVSHMGAHVPLPRDELLEKLNKVVHLLEEQKHEKTGHVTEELILYCFLGVFVIFIVDSFVRVGKYVRT